MCSISSNLLGMSSPFVLHYDYFVQHSDEVLELLLSQTFKPQTENEQSEQLRGEELAHTLCLLL